MESKSKNTKVIAFSLSCLFFLFSLINTVIKENFGLRAISSDLDSFSTLRIIFIIMSGYGFAVVIAFQVWRKKILDRLSKRKQTFQPEIIFLLINYLLLVSPTLYGQVLYFGGLPIREFFYFIGTSFLATLAWAIFDFLKN